MSFWYEPKKEDIDFSDDFTEIHIAIGNEFEESTYTSVKTQDIIELLKENELI